MVILLGVDHTVNTSIHWAEKLANRKSFIRWALTPQGVVECPDFPACSNGFNAISPHLDQAIQRVQSGSSLVQAIQINTLVETVRSLIQRSLIQDDPYALLCENLGCERCNAVRQSFKQ